MRSVHFRVEDDLYLRIQEEAEQQDLSVASFARVATVARTILWGVRRGAPWADLESVREALEIIEEIERRDTAAPSEARQGATGGSAPFARSWSVSGQHRRKGRRPRREARPGDAPAPNWVRMHLLRISWKGPRLAAATMRWS